MNLPSELADFRLADQFGHEHARDTLRGRPLLLVAGDRAGSRHVPAWIAALDAAVRATGSGDGRDDVHARAAERLAVLGVADLRGVPALMRRMVRALLPRDERRPVLLDWEGTLGAAHDFARGGCTVLVVDADGRIVARASGGAPDDAEVARLAAAVATVLGEPA